jgi:hypothetical protein
LLKEHGIQPEPRDANSNALRDLSNTWKNGLRAVRGRPVLVSILVITLLTGAASEGYDSLWETHLINGSGFPAGLSTTTWFGILAYVGILLGFLTVQVAAKRLDMGHERTVTTACSC